MRQYINTHKGILFATLTALLWGLIAIFMKVSLTVLAPIDIIWFRFTCAFLGLSIWFLYKKPKAFKTLFRPPLLLVISTVCLGLNYIGFTTGLKYTSPNIAQVFIQIGPVLLALSGILLFREKLQRLQVVGFLLVIAGMLVFYREQLQELSQDIGQYRLGVLFTLFGGITWAMYAVFHKVLVRTHLPMELNLFLFGMPALAFLPFVHFQHFMHLSGVDWGILLFLGLNTLVSYNTLAYAFKHLEANKVSVIITLNPIITFVGMAILTAIEVSWIAAERFTLLTMTGALVVLLGVIFTISGRKKQEVNKWVNEPGKKRISNNI